MGSDMKIQDGEWTVCKCPTRDLTFAANDLGTLWLVRYQNDEFEGEIGVFQGKRAEAHARLFCASKQLLAACEEAEQAMACGEPSKGNGCFDLECWSVVMDQLRAAIAAATTEQ